MKRYLAVAVAITLIAAAATVAAQAPGWKQRIDASTSATDPDPAGQVKFMAMAGGFHTANPQAAIFWNPKNAATGNYTLKATFAQNQRSSHPELPGSAVRRQGSRRARARATPTSRCAQNGTWLVKQRNGEATKDVARGANPAVVQLDAGGKATNTLEVRVAADKIDYVVNGTVVGSSPKTGVTTDGIYGFRVNHALPDVMITGLARYASSFRLQPEDRFPSRAAVHRRRAFVYGATRSAPCDAAPPPCRDRGRQSRSLRRQTCLADAPPRGYPGGAKADGRASRSPREASRTRVCSTRCARSGASSSFPPTSRRAPTTIRPLPIGYDQTISQPFIVAYMTEALGVEPHHKVLEIGTGSGYQAAVLGELARTVYTIEIVPELARRAASTLKSLGYRQCSRARGRWICRLAASTRRSIASWSRPRQPKSPGRCIDQLAVGGRLIIPVGEQGSTQWLTVVERTAKGVTERRTIPVQFVPFTRTR